MALQFPVTRSVFDATALRDLVEAAWDCGKILSCELVSVGLDDTWRLSAADGRQYALRAWRAGLAAAPDIVHEVEALGHLASRGVPVSVPVQLGNGEPLTALHAPEGERLLALFTWAPGKETDFEDEIEAFRYGRAEAILHEATADLHARHEGRAIDFAHLVEKPLELMEGRFRHRPRDLEWLRHLASRLHERLSAIPHAELGRGFCHGNLAGRNARIDKDGTVTFYNFDSCGHGWLAYDLATFRWATRLAGLGPGPWAAFLRGYEEVRKLREADLGAIPLLVGARHFSHLGFRVLEAECLGSERFDERHCDTELRFLREWEKDCLSRS